MCKRTVLGRAIRCVRTPDSPALPDGNCLRAASGAVETSGMTMEDHAATEWWELPSAPPPCRRWRPLRPSPCDKTPGVPLISPLVEHSCPRLWLALPRWRPRPECWILSSVCVSLSWSNRSIQLCAHPFADEEAKVVSYGRFTSSAHGPAPSA